MKSWFRGWRLIVRKRNYRFALRHLGNALYGLTHMRCSRCHGRKGRTWMRICSRCFLDAIFAIPLEEEEAPDGQV